MKTVLMIFVALCCLTCQGEARAQEVYTYSDIQFDPTDPSKVMGTGYMQVD